MSVIFLKKLTMQVLAESLNLSRVTIWKVLSGKEGVAPETAERVRAAVALFKEEHRETAPSVIARPRQVAVLMPRAETSMFWMSILEQLAIDLNKQKILLNYLPCGDSLAAAEDLIKTLAPPETNGLIVVNVYDRDLLSQISAIPLPKVYYDAPCLFGAAGLHGDLLLVDGRAAVENITENLIHTKRCRRLGFIGDIQYARTNRLRYDGFVAACKKNGLDIRPEFCCLHILSARPQERVDTFLRRLDEWPDAFVCVNDYMAFLVYNLLRDMGGDIPGGLTLTGFDDSKEFMLEYHHITTVHVQKSMLGRRLISQLMYRMENPEADYEEIMIQPKIVYR